jgi:putative ABC transport system substrate-binding protein
MRKNRLATLFAVTLFLLNVTESESQQRARIPRIGVLLPESGPNESQTLKGFREGLKEAGYKDGETIILEVQDVKGARAQLQRAVNDFVGKKVDVIFATGTRATQAAMAATKQIPIEQIPIVFRHPGDPVALGWVKNVNRPGGNLTGVAGFSGNMHQKRLEVFKQVVPSLRRVHIFYDANNRFSPEHFDAAQKAATQFKIEVVEHPVKTVDELKGSLGMIQTQRGDGIFHVPDDLVESQANFLFDEAKKQRLPTMFHEDIWAAKGSLAAYGPNYYEMGRQAAQLADKIIKGAHPKDLAVVQANKFDLVLNLRTASAIGLDIAPDIVKKADRVIR